MSEIVKTEPARVVCPECGASGATYDDVHVGIGTPVFGTISKRYLCSLCHFIAWGADAMRANGINTLADTPDVWRAAAQRYTKRMRQVKP